MKKPKFIKTDRAKTGWPPGMLQDDSKEFSKWLASKPEARWLVRRWASEIGEGME